MSAPLRCAQPQHGARATSVIAIGQRDRAAPAFGQLARNREAQPGTGCTRTARGPAMEALEDLLLLARRQARALVEHLDVTAVHADADAAVPRVSDGVLDQRVECPLRVRRRAEHALWPMIVRAHQLNPA